jgi:hypothetical protein
MSSSPQPNFSTEPPLPEGSAGVVPPPPPPLIQPGPPIFPAWTGWDVLAVLVFTIVSVLVLSLVAIFVLATRPGHRPISFTNVSADPALLPAVLISQAVAYLLVLIFMYMMVRSRSGQTFGQAIQWRWPGKSLPLFFGTGVLLALAVDSLTRFLPIPKSLPMDSYFHAEMSAYMMAIFGITLAPLMEELFFRGMLFPWLERKLGQYAWFRAGTRGVVTAILVTAAAFAAIHGAQLGYAWAPIFSIFVVGIAFTLVRVRTNSVASCFLVHCGYNSALFATLWWVSDHFRHLDKVSG